MRVARWMWLVGAVLVLSAPRADAGRAAPARRQHGAPAAAPEPYRGAVLVDAASGRVLFEKDAHRQAPPASMTKMMLMLLVAERVRDGKLRWDEPVVTSRKASQMGGSQVYLKEGETFSLGEMMQAIAIHSANDAAVAVAEAVAGSTDAFVELMNARAKELGMKDTIYRSVHGLPPGKGAEPDLSSAYDMALVARALVEFPDVMRWSGTRETTFRNGAMTLTNTNRLVRQTDWVDGLKTGYYAQAGFSVTATAQRGGLRLIAVILGDPAKRDCFAQAAGLLQQGFSTYEARVAVNQGDTITNNLLVRDGSPRFVRVVAGRTVSVLSRRGEKHELSVAVEVPDDLHAPLPANTPIGEVVVRDGENVVGRAPAITAQAVEKEKSLLDWLF